jgi:acetoacetyl-CoA reductase/3-oxoacyl-[acyl-carrier protein] reductase
VAQSPDKVALVTGASRGIGAGIALALGRAGWRVGVGFRERVGLANELAARLSEAVAIEIDVAEPASVEAAFARVERELGPPALLVNNAAIAEVKPFEELTDQDWERMLDVNLLGPVRCIRRALPGMRERRFGRIVNLSSIGGQWGGVQQLHYAAAKAALINLTRSIARISSADGITCNAIAPGLVATEMSAPELASEDGRAKLRAIPCARLGTSDEIGATVVFLASEGAGYVTGQTINLNGGMYFAA